MTMLREVSADPPAAAPTRARADGWRPRRALRLLREPVVVLGVVTSLVLVVLVVVPLVGLIATTLRPAGLQAWRDVVASPLSPNLFYEPLVNSLVVGTLTAVGATLIGGGLAWLVMMTDVPLKRTIGLLASLPFAVPSFALALAWETVFRNGRVGGRVGLLQDLGLAVPDWLAWARCRSAPPWWRTTTRSPS